jgi:hypothetical protein
MEWTIVGVISVLVGLFLSIASPMIKNIKEKANETK